MADYKWSTDSTADGVLRYSDGASIPNAPGNRDWNEWVAYDAGGGLTDPYQTEQEIKDSNSAQAAQAQLQSIRELQAEDYRISFGLPPTMDDQDKLNRVNHVSLMQGDIDNPSSDQVYSPPLPPGVNPPPHETLIISVKREPGWQGNLGYVAVISSMTEDFVPTNLALSVYSAAECTGYLYTTGAFVWNAGEERWEAICPAGQEPGDVDIFFGALYGAAELACFTLAAGIPEEVYTVYQSV